MKNKWNVHELHNMLVQEETRLKNQEITPLIMWTIKELEKKACKKHGKDKGPLKINESFTKLQKINELWIFLKELF